MTGEAFLGETCFAYLLTSLLACFAPSFFVTVPDLIHHHPAFAMQCGLNRRYVRTYVSMSSSPFPAGQFHLFQALDCSIPMPVQAVHRCLDRTKYGTQSHNTYQISPPTYLSIYLPTYLPTYLHTYNLPTLGHHHHHHRNNDHNFSSASPPGSG
jgi:hypothetical protein